MQAQDTQGRIVAVTLALLRIMTALVFLQHGLQKLLGFPIAPLPSYRHISLAGLAGLLEVVSTPFLLAGLFTRPWSFLLSGLMAAAYFMGHAGNGFFPLANGGDVAVLCCFIFLYLAAAGGGAWSLDALLARRRADRASDAPGLAGELPARPRTS